MSNSNNESREVSCDQNDDSIECRLPNINCLIKGKHFEFAIGRRIARGRFGAVYEVLRRSDGKRFAAKLEVCDFHFHGLNMDFKVLEKANSISCKHFAQLIDHGKIQGFFKFIVMPMLGDNLHKLRLTFVECHFSLSTALRLGLQTLTSLNELHLMGYIHRDVKASNYVIGCKIGSEPPLVYLIDFGLCRNFCDSNNEIKPARSKAPFRGTTRYASLAAHNEEEMSPKDDLESWFYMIVEMISGELPWGDLNHSFRDEVKQRKENSRKHDGLQLLLKDCPKVEFRRILNYIDSLHYSSQPDYTFLSQLLHLAIKNYGIRMNESYDWEDE